MPDFVTHPRRFRVTIEDEVVAITNDLSVSSSLEQLATVAEFGYASRPYPVFAPGDSVLIEYVDLAAELAYPIFGGTIDGFEVDTTPWTFRVRCVDQLEKFRRTKTGSDMDLTGMTDGEAWKAVADYCGVTYDDADIVDAGYSLGAREAIKWHADGSTPGSRIIQELDDVFRTKTMTIGDNRVIRIAYEPFPDDDDRNYRTYTKGSSIDYATHHRSYGGRDQIQTIWNVTGVTVEDANSCENTPWARAVAGNAQLGSRVRTVEQSFQSDLIQDESLARFIVRWKMGETSRQPDTAAADVETDPQLHPGRKIAVVDNTYGITANPRYYLVTSVTINGYQTALELSAGPGGDEGVVTSGVDHVCGDSHSDNNWEDGFDAPGFGDFPGLDGIGVDLGDFTGTPPPIITPAPEDEPLICESIDEQMVRFDRDEAAFRSPWREVSGPWTVMRDDGGVIVGGESLTYILRNPSGQLRLNSDEDPGTQSSATDIELGPGPSFTVCGEVAFCGIASRLTVGVNRTDTEASYAAVVLYGAPDGFQATISGDTREFVGVINLGNGGGVTTDFDWGPSEFGNGALHRNTGHWFPHGGGVGGIPNSGPGATPSAFDFHPFCVSFDLSDQYQQGYAETDVGSGHNRSEQCVSAGCIGGGEPATYTPDPFNHNIVISGQGAYIDSTCPPVLLRNLAVGQANCIPNPDYVEPEERD